jgi:hypothetical protein
MEHAEIQALVARLARPHASGGRVVERAAILAEGGDFAAIVDWITEHGGAPETAQPEVVATGLHGARRDARVTGSNRAPLRFVLPAEALA